MTLERQPVQSLSDHKIARTFCVSQERANSRANEWSGAKQMVVPSYLEIAKGEEWVRGEKRKIRPNKNHRNRQRKTKRKKENKNYSFLVFSTTKFAPAPDQ